MSVKGQQPNGLYSLGDQAEATAGGRSRGIRYNAGRLVTSDLDVYPTARAAGSTGYLGGVQVRTGNNPTDANTNLGLEVTAATGLGARAVAGSGVSYTANDRGGKAQRAISYNFMLFRPATSRNKDSSTAFTDTAARSAAEAGLGNGPVAMAWGLETASFSRAWRDAAVKEGRQNKWRNSMRRHLLQLAAGKPARQQAASPAVQQQRS